MVPPSARRDARRALDVDEEGVDRIGEPDELQAAAGERARLDRAAVGIFGEPVGRRPGEAEAPDRARAAGWPGSISTRSSGWR